MRFKGVLALGALCSLLGACSNSDSGSEADIWHFRGVNVVNDSPTVQFYISDTGVEVADYGAATDYHPARSGTHAIRLGIRNPSDLTRNDQGYTAIGSSESFDFQGPTDYTLIAAGTVADPRKFLITGTSREAVADNVVEYQFVNAAVDAGALEVLVLAPEAGITVAQSIGTLALGVAGEATNLTIPAASGAAESDERAVNITIEVRDGTGATIYQSSAFNVKERNRLLFVLADHFGPPNISPVKVLAVAGVDALTATNLFDPHDGTELRFGNLSPDAGPLDLIVNGNGFASGVALGERSAYASMPAATAAASATPAGNPGSILFSQNVTLSPARSHTLYAQGPLASITGVLVADERRSVATEARFRFLHAAATESGGAIDIYLRRSGEELDLTVRTPPAPTIADLAYRAASGTFALKPGTYDVYFARANAESTILGPVPLSVAGGSVQTLALADSPVGSLTLLPVDDAGP